MLDNLKQSALCYMHCHLIGNMFEGIVVPTILYGHEAWAHNARSRKRLKGLKLNAIKQNASVR